jgi:hypothetical protein
MWCVSTAVLPEKVEDRDSGKFSLNHSTVELFPPTIREFVPSLTGVSSSSAAYPGLTCVREN